MEDIKKDFEILSNLKEINYTFNTGDKSIIEYTTQKIFGELKSIIISTKEMINIEISLANFPDIILYKKDRLIGDKYLSLKDIATFFNDEQHVHPVSWNLNDMLLIKIISNYNTIIKVIIRWK